MDKIIENIERGIVNGKERGRLKPCPFCGGEAKLIHDIMGHAWAQYKILCSRYRYEHNMDAKDYGCIGKTHPYDEREDVIKVWNKRAL